MDDPPESAPGIFSSLRRLAVGLLATAQNRLELFALELQEEKCRLIELVIWVSALVALGLMSLAMVTLTPHPARDRTTIRTAHGTLETEDFTFAVRGA